jgi:hypothetical protein
VALLVSRVRIDQGIGIGHKPVVQTKRNGLAAELAQRLQPAGENVGDRKIGARMNDEYSHFQHHLPSAIREAGSIRPRPV